jgi:AraC-like DNA-binding protein
MSASKFVDSYFDAWNNRDPEGVAEHLSSDGTYRDVPENQQRSHNELIVTLKDFFSVYKHRYELIGSIMDGDNTIAFQYRMYPKEKHGINKPSISYRGAEFITLNGSRALTIVDYYDVPSNTETCKYAKSGLTNGQLLEYKQRLDNAMRSRQLFLRPDMTLPILAQAVDCSVNQLSQVINAGFGMSFFDYINRFRIQFARDLLERPDSQGDAILNIAFMVGFNSNSAFYSAFKKYVNQTPAQYRRNYLD